VNLLRHIYEGLEATLRSIISERVKQVKFVLTENMVKTKNLGACMHSLSKRRCGTGANNLNFKEQIGVFAHLFKLWVFLFIVYMLHALIVCLRFGINTAYDVSVIFFNQFLLDSTTKLTCLKCSIDLCSSALALFINLMFYSSCF
jgi:hypothetical protein